MYRDEARQVWWVGISSVIGYSQLMRTNKLETVLFWDCWLVSLFIIQSISDILAFSPTVYVCRRIWMVICQPYTSFKISSPRTPLPLRTSLLASDSSSRSRLWPALLPPRTLLKKWRPQQRQKRERGRRRRRRRRVRWKRGRMVEREEAKRL